jgi:hypothetical protein
MISMSMMGVGATALAALMATGDGDGDTAPRPSATTLPALAAPVRVEAGGKAIDTEVGHAHPLVADWDGDGVNDLLVGQFGDGILWTYRNEGTNANAKLAAGVKFKDGGKDGRVPTG